MSILLLIFLNFKSFAADQLNIKFGPEFTFASTSPEAKGVAENYHLSDLRHRMYSHLVIGQPIEAKFAHDVSHSKFESPNGWWVKLHMDQGVVEAAMSHMNLDDWKRFSADIQDALFVSAANEALFPAEYLGGGHINIDTTELLKNPLLLRNVVVDFINHNELYMGIFNYDTNSALPFSLMDQAQIDHFKLTIERWDELIVEAENHLEYQFQDSMLYELYQTPSGVRDPFITLWYNENARRGKNMAMRFFSQGVNRLELRAVRAQKNIGVWLRQISLINSRINYLSKFTEPIPFEFKLKHPPADSKEAAQEMQLNPPIDPQDALKAFYEYVAESNENWSDHRDYLWPQWLRNGELKKFESSDWFKRQKSKCESYL